MFIVWSVPSAIALAGARQYKMALPGYHFNFPRDFAAHEDYKTEWWYYTGHLEADDGSRYGYELTFFRVGMNVAEAATDQDVTASSRLTGQAPCKTVVHAPNKHYSPWTVNNAYLAHFAVSDLGRQQFFHARKLTRAGVGFAGAQENSYRVWNQNWSVQQSAAKQLLKAQSGDYALSLALIPGKPLVVHGENGVSQKAACVGCASHYFSFTRLNAEGELVVRGKHLKVHGISWMDHEFGSNQLTAEQVGWDWFSVQLDDNTELMLYVMRRKDGSVDPHSSGTLVAADGTAQHLSLPDYTIQAQGKWRSPSSKAVYPMGWRLSSPSRGLQLVIKPEMENQELTKEGDRDVTYWEGACTVSGQVNGKPVHGQAYVEMTGYDAAFSKSI
jgi:predicted secreted hydrolase